MTNAKCAKLAWQAALLTSTCALTPVVVTACFKDFNSCKDTSTCAPPGSLGGEGGEAGANDGKIASADDGSAGSPSTGGASTDSSDESGHQGNSSGGSGGSADSGSNSSGGGTDSTSQCNSDSDCDDGLHCNGEESCEDGECTAGTPIACTNPDRRHCEVNCEETEGAAECVVTALDKDGDGFASAQCEQDPGLDCNDNDEAINPDAEEICDGIDNDCNGAVDVMDGLEFNSTVGEIPNAVEVDVDWSPVSENFGVAFESGGILFAYLLDNGTLEGSVPLVESTDTTLYSAPRISWGADFWGVVFAHGGGQYFYRVDSAGTPLGLTTSNSKPPAFNDLAWRVTGDWLAVRNTSTEVIVERVMLDDPSSFIPGVNISTSATAPRIATSASDSAVVWQGDGSNDIAWSHISGSLSASAPEPLATDGQLPRIATINDGYAITWATESGFIYETRALDGSALCGPVDVDFGDGVLDASDEATPLYTEYGTLVVAVDEGSDEVSLFRFDDGCNMDTEKSLDSTAQDPRNPNLAVGNGTVAVVWSGTVTPDGAPSEPRGFARIFGELLCE